MPPRPAAEGGPSSSSSAIPASVYPTDSVTDVAESLGLNKLKDPVAAALAADVEYRIRDVVQQAAKFMRHAKRNQLTTADVDAALRAKNIEPVYGFLPTSLGKSTSNLASSSFAGPAYRRVQTASGPLHFVDDEEIDFDKVLQSAPRLRLGRGVGWGAHWLAIEGVQPAVPQNPSPAPVASTDASQHALSQAHLSFSGGASAPLPGATPNTPLAAHLGNATARPLVKHVLSRELQLYFEKLTSAIVAPPSSADVTVPSAEGDVVDAQGDTSMSSAPRSSPIVVVKLAGAKVGPSAQSSTLADFAARPSGNTVRDAALSSLRGDPGLHQLVPYLVQWVGERVALALSAPAVEGASGSDEASSVVQEELSRMLAVTHALLVNPHLFIEPYLHQTLPTLLSILLTSSLPREADALRQHAAAVLAHLVTSYANAYPSLRPRVVRTLLGALLAGTHDEGEEPSAADVQEDEAGPRPALGTKLGALIALRRLGAGAVRALVLGPGGAEVLRRSKRGDMDAAAAEQEFRDLSPLARLARWVAHQRAADGNSEGPRELVAECEMALRSLSSDASASFEKERLGPLFGTALEGLLGEDALRALGALLGEVESEGEADL